MGNLGSYLLVIIRSLLWPPMGVILFEEQIMQWCYATLKVYILANGANIMIAFAVYAVIMFVVFERNPIGHRMHHGIGRFIGFIFRLLFVIIFGWAMLLYGALVGGLRGEGTAGEDNARQTITIRRHYFHHMIEVSQRFTRLSWHFRFGRWLFRASYWVLGHIRVIDERPRLHRTLARGVALFVIVYRAWEIPYLLTH